MVICNFKGGLGNQLFQIATTLAVADDNNDEAVFFSFSNLQQGKQPTNYLDNLYKKLTFNDNVVSKNIYSELNFSYNKIPYQENLCLNGYFQSEKYFKHHRQIILDKFYHYDYSMESKYNKLFGHEETVSIHVRRGDYQTIIVNGEQYHPPCELNYYQSALEHFSDKEYKFLVFSDDIEWCKQVFDDDFNFIEGEEDYVDLLLMARCKHNIIANSSFSWWGAWLNRNNNKRVIAPKKWFGSVANLDSKDLLPKGWITL